MTYDAVLAARRGLGVEEQRLARPQLVAATRWVLFAEAQVRHLRDLRELVAIDPPDSLVGGERTRFMANRQTGRAELKELEALLYPDEA